MDSWSRRRWSPRWRSLARIRTRDRYTVYGLVGDVLRGNPTPDDGFTGSSSG